VRTNVDDTKFIIRVVAVVVAVAVVAAAQAFDAT